MSFIINPYRFAAPSGPTPIAWYEADAITGLSDGDPLSTWQDQSGNGYDITASGSERPLYKTNIINGLPSVRFDGTDDLMGNSGYLTFSSSFTIFAVTKNGIRKSFNGILRTGEDATTNSHMEIYWSEGSSNSGHSAILMNRRLASLTYVRAYDVGPSVDNFYIGCWNNSGSALAQYINGTLLTVNESGGSTFTVVEQSKLFVGVGYQGEILDGDHAEIKIYSPELSETERNAVFASLNAKYAIY